MNTSTITRTNHETAVAAQNVRAARSARTRTRNPQPRQLDPIDQAFGELFDAGRITWVNDMPVVA